MYFVNHYSAPIVALVALILGMLVVRRRGGKRSHWLSLGIATMFLVVIWLVVRPVASRVAITNDQPTLLEVQSPYCLGCVAMKPVVDRLEKSLRDKLTVRRVDIQSDEGQELVTKYQIEMTPTFIFLDNEGKEQWRSVGMLDTGKVRDTKLNRGARGP